jgi:hypothetical protein
MKIVITTLSVGENYTRDYTLKLIHDVLELSNLDIYITTDFPNIIKEKYGNNDRIKITTVNRDDLVIRVKVGESASDFNFNLRYLCFDPVKELEDTLVIFTDCDNSFDWWDEKLITEFTTNCINDGFDFFAPRNSFYWSTYRNSFLKENDPKLGNYWHKVVNYNLDMLDESNDKASLPAEYLLIFYNKDKKLVKFYEKWKWYHDYLISKETSEGTWAEGFEIGISAYYANFIAYDISFCHPLWGRMFTASGYKNGHKGSVWHPTES